jgi:hypothetical protein
MQHQPVTQSVALSRSFFLNEAKDLPIPLIKKKIESLGYKGAKLRKQKSTLSRYQGAQIFSSGYFPKGGTTLNVTNNERGH